MDEDERMPTLEEFIAIEKHNDQVRKTLKEFIDHPEKFPLLSGDSVNYDLSSIRSF